MSMSDERTIPASEWRKEEHRQLVARSVLSTREPGYAAHQIAADFCAREAEKAEAREKCERGDHDWFFGYDFVAAPPGGAALLREARAAERMRVALIEARDGLSWAHSRLAAHDDASGMEQVGHCHALILKALSEQGGGNG